jgi:hypothetical protein
LIRNISSLGELIQEQDDELLTRKRKIEENLQLPKRVKIEEEYQVGDQVAGKVEGNWILATVLNKLPVKGKIEIEVISG